MLSLAGPRPIPLDTLVCKELLGISWLPPILGLCPFNSIQKGPVSIPSVPTPFGIRLWGTEESKPMCSSAITRTVHPSNLPTSANNFATSATNIDPCNLPDIETLHQQTGKPPVPPTSVPLFCTAFDRCALARAAKTKSLRELNQANQICPAPNQQA